MTNTLHICSFYYKCDDLNCSHKKPHKTIIGCKKGYCLRKFKKDKDIRFILFEYIQLVKCIPYIELISQEDIEL